MNTDIINYEGTTCLLLKPEVVDNTAYPFAFDAATPETKSWSYRLLPTRAVGGLTTAQLEAWLGASQRGALRADWEQMGSHVVGWLTIYAEPRDGDGSSSSHRAQFERGPDLDIAPPEKSPEPPKPSRGMDMDF